MADKLNKAALDALPHPLIAVRHGGNDWPIYDICVETGLTRIDVVGKLQTIDFAEVLHIRDGEFVTHDADDFYIEDETGEGMHTDKDAEITSKIAAQRLAAYSAKVQADLADIRQEATWITKDGGRHATLEAAMRWQVRNKIIDTIDERHDQCDSEGNLVQPGWFYKSSEQIADNAEALFRLLEPYFKRMPIDTE
jgi:hypothetical protein